MTDDPFAPDAPDLQTVLDALEDADCRAVVEHLDGPMTAEEIADACDLPLSTTYRKLERLSDASLLEERTERREDGRQVTRYAPAFDEVRITFDERRAFDVEIEERSRTAAERLSELWSEVSKETER